MISSISYLFPSRKGFYTQTTKKGISRSKPSSRKAPPKHAAIQVSDATQQEMLISHASKGEKKAYMTYHHSLYYRRSTRMSLASGNSTIMVHAWFAFMLIALIWEFDFSAFMVLIIAILNDGTIMTISKDRVKPSPTPDSWKLKEIFATGIVLGGYQAVMSVVFFWSIHKTDFFSDKFGVRSIMDNNDELMGAVYLQSSAIFVTRSRSWSFVERPGAFLMIAFVIAQLVTTLIAVYADSGRLLRLRELHTLKGHVESVAKLKGLDIDTAGHHYMCSCSCTYTFYQNQPIMTLVEFLCLYIQMLLVRFFFNSEERFDMFFFLRILQIRQGMYTSVFGAREPETGRILAFKKARFDNFEADSVRSITRQIVILRKLNQVFLFNQKLMVGLSIWGIRAYIKRFMQDVDACVRKLKVEALARARKEFVHTSNGFVLCRKSNKVEKDHEKSYIWWLVVKRVLPVTIKLRSKKINIIVAICFQIIVVPRNYLFFR
ncbi:LOW QUALITY PROTEIN: hypothetical protein HID58_007366 [Brassica napus]|uniref:Uncharacterized protein n=1 Tax=Brassica napus TaxID=3708 RepID=A0ABQ8EE19_BRANA|nr:LOW QUALITY PROTEIN: hypothetical protein HID58_007366 [Brassica napus]